MQEREREVPRTGPGGSAPDDDPLSADRADAERMLNAADQQIGRAMSQDSAAFLKANQQTVGQ
jgi:hypothetical protein